MWLYENQEFTDEKIGEANGFVYIITNKTDGRRYVGKKLFTKSKIYQKNKKKRRKRVSSDWLNYWGSNEELKADVKRLGPENFLRTIEVLCYSKAELTYCETRLIFLHDCLLYPEKWYNSWVSCKINRNTLINTKSKREAVL